MDKPQLAGLRVLLVEDEILVAMLLEDMLIEAGCEIVGPARSLSTAQQLLEVDGADMAVLDVNIVGEPVYPFADTLAARNIPFLLVTGYAMNDIAPQLRDRPVLRKPFRYQEFRKALRGLRAGPTPKP